MSGLYFRISQTFGSNHSKARNTCVYRKEEKRSGFHARLETKGPGLLHLPCDPDLEPPSMAGRDRFNYPPMAFLVSVLFSSNLLAKLEERRYFERSGLFKSFVYLLMYV